MTTKNTDILIDLVETLMSKAEDFDRYDDDVYDELFVLSANLKDGDITSIQDTATAIFTAFHNKINSVKGVTEIEEDEDEELEDEDFDLLIEEMQKEELSGGYQKKAPKHYSSIVDTFINEVGEYQEKLFSDIMGEKLTAIADEDSFFDEKVKSTAVLIEDYAISAHDTGYLEGLKSAFRYFQSRDVKHWDTSYDQLNDHIERMEKKIAKKAEDGTHFDF